jgi:predicted DNA-binding transcriptional regulator YafY
MFGNKNEKQGRLERMVEIIAKSPQGITQAALAHLLGVGRSTVNKDLVALHQRGVRLAEDKQGRLYRAD